jgi:HEAT repeat protein
VSIRIEAASALSAFASRSQRIIAVLLDVISAEGRARNAEPELIQKAVHSMIRLGSDGRQALIKLIKNRKGPGFHDALSAMIFLGEDAKPAAPILLEVLREPDVQARETTIRALFALGSPENIASLPILIDLLKEEPALVRTRAAWLINFLDPNNRAILPVLLKDLKAEDVLARRLAVEVLGNIGPRARVAIDPLIKCFNDSDLEVRMEAASSLGRIGLASVPDLLKALQTNDQEVCLYSIRALRGIGHRPKEVVSMLEAIATGKRTNRCSRPALLRVEAAAALSSIDPENAVSLPALQWALHDTDPDVRREAAYELGRCQPAPRSAIPTLLACLKDSNPGVRIHALAALRLMNADTLSALAAALKDLDEGVRTDAARALAGIGPAAVPALIEALRTGDENVRRSAMNALEDMRPLPEIFRPVLSDIAGGLLPGPHDKATRLLKRLPKRAAGRKVKPENRKILD